MRKYLIAPLVLILSINNVLAGAGSSRPAAEEDNRLKAKATTPKSFFESPEARHMATGAAILAAGIYAYKCYQTSDDTVTSSKPRRTSSYSDSSDDSEEEYVYTSKTKYSYASKPVDIEAFKRENSTTPQIDLSVYEEDSWRHESAKIDLHPVFNNNPRKHLRQQIFELQHAYFLGKSTENKVHIITGTGIKRPGPNYILQNNVEIWLTEDYIQRRITRYWQPQPGIFTVILRKEKLD
jgi:DNA-nicking Smr family endonuclease